MSVLVASVAAHAASAEPVEFDAWLRRLPGQFAIDTTAKPATVPCTSRMRQCGPPTNDPPVMLDMKIAELAAKRGATPRSMECWTIGPGPGIYCVMNWDAAKGAPVALLPLGLLFGVDPDVHAIRMLLVFASGNAVEAQSTLTGDVAYFAWNKGSMGLQLQAPAHGRFINLSLVMDTRAGGSKDSQRLEGMFELRRQQAKPVNEEPAPAQP
jgi:hypothetical protein